VFKHPAISMQGGPQQTGHCVLTTNPPQCLCRCPGNACRTLLKKTGQPSRGQWVTPEARDVSRCLPDI